MTTTIRQSDNRTIRPQPQAPTRRFQVCSRAAGDFAVQRFDGARIVRWDVYPTREEAVQMCRMANTTLPKP